MSISDGDGASTKFSTQIGLLNKIEGSAESFSRSTEEMLKSVESSPKDGAKDALEVEGFAAKEFLASIQRGHFFQRHESRAVFGNFARAAGALRGQYSNAAQTSIPIVLEQDSNRFFMPRGDKWLVTGLMAVRDAALEWRAPLVQLATRFWKPRFERHFAMLFGTMLPVLKWLDTSPVIASVRGSTDMLLRAMAIPLDAPPETVLAASFGVGLIVRDLAAIAGEDKSTLTQQDEEELLAALKDLPDWAKAHMEQLEKRLDAWRKEMGLEEKGGLDSDVLGFLGMHVQALACGFRALTDAVVSKLPSDHDQNQELIKNILNGITFGYSEKSEQLSGLGEKKLRQMLVNLENEAVSKRQAAKEKGDEQRRDDEGNEEAEEGDTLLYPDVIQDKHEEPEEVADEIVQHQEHRLYQDDYGNPNDDVAKDDAGKGNLPQRGLSWADEVDEWIAQQQGDKSEESRRGGSSKQP
jgi:hypothetical protein